MAIFLLANGPMPTAAAFAPVTTGTAVKTMLQLEPLAALGVKVLEWGCSFDGSVAATPGRVELIETDVAATVTPYAAADLTRLDLDALQAGTTLSELIEVGASASGYTATAEGPVAAVRNLDAPQLIAPTTQYQKQFPAGRQPVIRQNKFARIRVTFGAAVLCYCYLVVQT